MSKGLFLGFLVLSGVAGCSSRSEAADDALRGAFIYEENGTTKSMDVATGAAKTIVTGYDPATTPDRRLVFVNADGLVETDADGLHTPRVIVQKHEASWFSDFVFTGWTMRDPRVSPDGTRIAFRDFESEGKVNRNVTVIVERATGRELGRLVGWPQGWTPDGRVIITDDGVRISDAAFTTSTRVDPDLVSVSSPRMSPDGSTIALSMQGGIYLMNADGSDLRQIIAERTPSYSGEKVNAGCPAWSSDGKYIAYRDGNYVQIATASGEPVTDRNDTSGMLDMYLVKGCFQWVQ